MSNILNSLSAKNKVFLLAVIILVAVAVPLTIIQVQKQQEIRQRASGEDMLLYLANNESCTSLLTTLPLSSSNLPLYLCLAAGTNKEGVSGFNITLSAAASLTFTSAEATSQSQTGFDMQIANATNTLNIKGFIKNIDNNVPVTTSLPLLKLNVATSQNSGNITITTTEITSLKQDAYLTVAASPFSFGTGAATVPAQPAAIRYNQQCITDLVAQHCGESNDPSCIQQWSHPTDSCILPSTTPSGTASTPGSSSCTANGNWCSGATPVGKGNCTQVSGSCNNPSFEFCWNCDAKAPTPGQTSPVSGGTYRAGDGQQSGAAPTYSPGSTSIPPGQLIALNFRGVTLPGISPDVGSADLKLTFFRGDNTASLQQIPGGPFTANIARSQAKDTFSGRVVFPASALQLPTSSLQVYFIQISVGSYQAKISGDDGTKARTITEIQSQQLSGLIPINIFTDGKDSIIPAVKLLSGDINGDGFIDGADLGIIVACFGKKNVLADSAGRTTDCSSKTQNRKFDVDIDKNRSVDGIDINLWSRGANGII